ncbi:MAG TPA: pseudouridine synthase [Gammaproteobacteria bacterium]|jgi:23S rRNA pseudouridine2457 synthase
MSRILLLNKPFDVLCQFTDAEGRHTLAEFVHEKGLYPAGRLDRDSEGMVLLTDDGSLQHCIAHPKHKLPKTYWVQVEGEPDDEALQRLRRGVELKDGLTRPATVERLEEPPIWDRDPPIRYRANIPTSWLTLTICEGRNRQVRRMTAAVGYPTLRLVRWAIGPWQLQGLQPGQWCELPGDEVNAFLQRCTRFAAPRPGGAASRTRRAPPDKRPRGEKRRR